MKKKTLKKLLILASICISIPTIGYASYVISNYNIGSFDDVVTQDQNVSMNKITFKNLDGSILEEKYIKKGEALNSSNVPLISNKRIKWLSEDNSGSVIDLCDSNFDSLIPQNDLVLKASEIQPSSSFTVGESVVNKNTGNDNNPGGNTTTKISNNSIILNEKVENDRHKPGANNKTILTNDIELGGSLNGVSITANYSSYVGKTFGKPNYDNSVTNNLTTLMNQANNDTHIGLNDPTNKNIDEYKPFNNGVNYCVSRITLKSDLILTNTTFNLGAMVGFYGNDYKWSQFNYQGYITGNYNEIDLNGHNLIIGSGSTLNAYGSITNSSPNSGKIIVENGGTFLGTAVIEQHNYERGLPVQYYYGGELFDSFRMPYINCNMRIKAGANLKCTLKLDFGGDNENFFDGIINLLGPNNTYAFCFNDGYVDRLVNYDSNVYAINNEFAKQNLLSQKISYKFYGCSNIITNNVEFSFTLSGNKIKVSIFKNGLMIPPYFQIYLYNSKISFIYSVTFLPGSYLFVDETSEVCLSGTALNLTANYPIVLNATDHIYQTIGSLNFVIEKSNYVDAARTFDPIGWIDNVHDDMGNGDNGRTAQIHYRTTDITSYYNKHRPAHCDMLGKITFKDIDNFTPTGLKHNVGGRINIKDIETFKNTVNSRNDVNLFASGAHIGPCTGHGNFMAPFKDHLVNVSDYYIAPLISNGNVLMDINNQTKIREDYQTVLSTYDKSTGLIKYKNDYFAFLHTDKSYTKWDGDITHAHNMIYGTGNRNDGESINNWKNGKDSYFGKFFKVTLNSNHSIHCSSVNANNKFDYIFFRGMFMPYDGTNVYIDKLRAGKSNLKGKGTVRAVAYYTDNAFFDHPEWRLL